MTTDCINAPESLPARLADMKARRDAASQFYTTLNYPPQQCNGDEDDFKTKHYFANFTKGLKHNQFGEVANPADYENLLAALKSGDPADFAAIPLNCLKPTSCAPCVGVRMQTPFTNPQAGHAFDTAGPDAQSLTMPPPPKFSSAVEVGEIAENYWLALARDVPFTAYDEDPITIESAADLTNFGAVFEGPKDAAGKVTTKTLFRGFTAGDAIGPYLSQFLVRDIPYGSQSILPMLTYALPDRNYMTNAADYLAAQDGCYPPADQVEEIAPRRIYRGRDLAQYVHIDELFQAYFNACLILITPPSRGGIGAPVDKGNPYAPFKHSNQAGFGTLGEPNFKTLVCEIATRALKAVWYQKWMAHRRIRPEVFGARIHFDLTASHHYPFDSVNYAKLKSGVLPVVHQKNGGHGYFLPVAFPEGSPIHPAYGAGHSTVAGACVTVLKALFDEDAILTTDLGIEPMMPTRDGKYLRPYTGADKNQMTVGTELNKLAGNISMARNFAGVHWRSDYTQSVMLGEKIALYYLQEYINTYNEANVSFTVTRFDPALPKVTLTKGAAPQMF